MSKTTIDTCFEGHEGRIIPAGSGLCTNGYWAYRKVLSSLGLTADLSFYSCKDEQNNFIVRPVSGYKPLVQFADKAKELFDVELQLEDLIRIEAIKTPNEMCRDVLPILFSPDRYPKLVCDYCLKKEE